MCFFKCNYNNVDTCLSFEEVFLFETRRIVSAKSGLVHFRLESS